jgi:heavy metal sensor kinase
MKLRRPELRRIARGLRFRLTASYALFFAVVFTLFATVLREQLKTTLANQTKELLNEEWSGMRGYLEIDRVHPSEPDKAYWNYTASDPEESLSVQEIKKIFVVTDASGKILDDVDGGDDDGLAVSNIYKDIGDKPADIRKMVSAAIATGKPGTAVWTRRSNSDGELFLIRSGVVYNRKRTAAFYVAIGASLEQNNAILKEFTWVYALVIPGALILGSLMGWFTAGRSLRPVHDVARAAQRITSSNLSLRIPSRQSGDELDFLILTFNRMIERLEASFQQIKQFSTDVSHELRTPITAIRGQLEVALFTAKTTEQYREAMFNALTDIDRLSQIVRALLLLSQAESGQLALQRSRVNLKDIVTDIVEQFQIVAEAAGVRLFESAPDDCIIDADHVQIERLLTNLLSNAIKFTPEGGEVRTTLRLSEDRAILTIEDTGRGIPAEHLPHIFDRFYRVPGSGTAPGPEQGLGLGLSFVAWIVRAHEGKIDVESTPGKGTTFTISLALAAPEVPGSAVARTDSEAAEPARS